MVTRFKSVLTLALIACCLGLTLVGDDGSRKSKSEARLTNSQMRERIIFCSSPPIPLAARLEGCVALEIRVDVQGRVENIWVISGHPLVVSAAIESVSTWRFQTSHKPITGELALCYKNGWDIQCKDHKQIQEKC